MNSRSKIEKWILADWGSNRNPELARKEELPVKCENGEDLAEKSYSHIKANENGTGSEANAPQEDKDFSPSASSWEPSDDSSSDDSDNEVAKSKTVKMEQYIRQYVKRRNSKKAPTPVHRPNAVVNVLKERQINVNNRSINDGRKRKYVEIPVINKSLPDSTQKKISPPKETVENITVRTQEILEMKSTFEKLFKMINDMKPESMRSRPVINTEINRGSVNENIEVVVSNAKTDELSYESERSERSLSEESNRSHDNVLISNKYHKIDSLNKHEKEHNEVDEWIPIGSGKTLIHKDKYRKVNWKSYTIATRTLLLATFPRRILATHSLTGKRSPAFQNKPAKMCLDPKIVSDIIIEITSKFKVKENLVRGIITTKCADECKMLKQRLQSKKSKKGPPICKVKGEATQQLQS